MLVMPEISVIGTISTQHITSSLVPSFIGAPRNNLKLQEAVTIRKQDKFIQ